MDELLHARQLRRVLPADPLAGLHPMIERETLKPEAEVATLTYHELGRLFFAVLKHVHLLSQGGTASLDNDSGRSKPGSVIPMAQADDLMGQRLVARFAKCATERGRREIIWDALDYIAQVKWAPDRSMQRGTVEWKQAIAKDQRPWSAIRRVYGVTDAEINRIRKRAA